MTARNLRETQFIVAESEVDWLHIFWEMVKPQPAPIVPGNTEFERFDNAAKMMFSVPKEALVKAEALHRKAKAAPRKPTRKLAQKPQYRFLRSLSGKHRLQLIDHKRRVLLVDHFMAVWANRAKVGLRVHFAPAFGCC